MVLPPGRQDDEEGQHEVPRGEGPASVGFQWAKVVEAGNRIVMEKGGSFIENVATGEKMKLRVGRGMYVFDVKYNNGEEGTITLDSRASTCGWRGC